MTDSTLPGIALGTPAYMAPEQVRGEPADHRADLFAFGCVLHELLSGERAFRRNTTVETMTAILNDEPPDLASMRPDAPPALDRIVQRCLEKRPERRFQSATDLAFALEGLAGSTPTALPSRAAGKSAGRLPLRRLAAILAVGVLMVFAGWIGSLLPREVPSPQPAIDCLISAGGLSGILNVLLAILEPGDEVLMTDPTYVGLINRVRLAGGVPRFVPLMPSAQGWRLDTETLSTTDPRTVKAALLMSPSMPTGAVFTQEEWQALIDFCQRANCWLINDAAMERILYDDRTVIHPASFPDMREKVITVGSASKEYRMIGWRVGWIVGPAGMIADIARVSITNVVCQT